MATSYQSRLGTAPEEAIKAPVAAASGVNLTLSGEQTINTIAGGQVSVVAGDRVLVANQTDGTENGIYDVSTGAWTRSKDWNASDDVVNGVLVPTTSGQLLYQATYSGTFQIGTTAPTFTEFGQDLISDLNDVYASLSAINYVIHVNTAVPTSGDGNDGDVWLKIPA